MQVVNKKGKIMNTNRKKETYDITDNEKGEFIIVSSSGEIMETFQKYHHAMEYIIGYLNNKDMIDNMDFDLYDEVYNQLDTTLKTQEDYIEANIKNYISLNNLNHLSFYFDYDVKEKFLNDLKVTYGMSLSLYNKLKTSSNEEFIYKLEEYSLITDLIYCYLDYEYVRRDVSASSNFDDEVIECEEGLLIKENLL